MSEQMEVQEEGSKKEIFLDLETMTTFVSCSRVIDNLLAYVFEGRAMNDWEMRRSLIAYGLLVAAEATQEHVDGGSANSVGDTVFIVNQKLLQILAAASKADEAVAARSATDETAEAAE